MTRIARVNPSIPIALVLMALTALLRLINIAGSPIRLDDEGTYVAQAFAVSQWGELAHYTYWYDHPPGGWLQIAAWMTLTGPGFGPNAVTAGRYLMVVAAVISAGLVWLLARRVGLPRWAAAAAVAVLAVSPLAISLGRSVYLDNLAVAWLLGALVLICSPRQRLSAMFGAALCFGVAVLTKETMLLFVPVVAWLVWLKAAPATRRYALAVFGAVCALVISTYVLMAVVRGELIPGPGHVSLWEGVKFQLWQRESSGSLSEAGSLKRHTIDEWLRLDPVLPLTAAPVALGGLLIQRLRPFAVGLLILVLAVVRPGYLPVPFVISAVPLVALLTAGIAAAVVQRVGQMARQPSTHWMRSAATLSVAFLGALTATLWVAGYRDVLGADDDAPMRQAQQWVSDNVSSRDRLIVDDAMWVDLVRDGRDRRNVVWSYKVDTDEQVQSAAPRGWSDYEWVISTPSMRANMPDSGVLNDAISHARTVATFGERGNRVDVLHVSSDASSPTTAATPALAAQVATRMAGASDPDALATLQSGTVDQRVVATLAVLSATQPVVLQTISSVDAEVVAGTPRREFRLTGPPEQLQAFATFLHRQKSPFDTETITLTATDLTVRFPPALTTVGLGGEPAQAPGGTATVRVSDLRQSAPAGRLELVRLDGAPGASLPLTPDESGYRPIPAGTYVMTTVEQRSGVPVMRQAFTIEPAGSYTLALFSAGETGALAAQLVPDTAPGQPVPTQSVRLMQASAQSGPVKLALSAAGGAHTVLADNASYGLVTGYGPQPAGRYDAVITAEGREWSQPVDVLADAPTTLVLTDGRDGPTLRQTRDVADAAPPFEPPALVLPQGEPEPDKVSAKPVSHEDPRRQVIPLALCVAFIAGTVVAAMRYQRRQRR
ncbi:MAG: glycosyltransferase family 39 protein [Actinomycetota bacterium]